MHTLTLLLFGPLAAKASCRAVSLSLPEGATLADLRRAFVQAYPQLAELAAASRFAVNQEFSPETTVVLQNTEIALLPPVSGG